MKKVLIVSGIPWTRSNRGIDIMTELFLELGCKVTHLVFPIYVYNNRWKNFQSENISSNLSQTFSSNIFVPYDDDKMYWLPKFLKKWIFYFHTKSIKNIDFNEFDIIVIESGKPVLLSELLPNNKFIIYRQSDPVWFMFKDSLLIEYEQKMLRKANLILIVRKSFLEEIPEDLREKVEIWKNGFNVDMLVEREIGNPYSSNKMKRVIYLGYTPIDPLTVEACATENKDCEFHIIGNCINKRLASKISKRYPNVVFHGFLPPERYLGYIKYSDIAYVPYDTSKVSIKYAGFSSKFLLFMFYKLPIVSYKVGQISEFEGLRVFFAESLSEFLENLRVVKNVGKIDYEIDWNYYSSDGRKQELKRIFREYGVVL